jgi:hypothetical protein
LLTLVERKTKLTKIARLPRATARATQKAAARRLKPIADFVHTITFDYGKEFATHQDITHALKATIFFRHAVSCMGARFERKHQRSHPRLLSKRYRLFYNRHRRGCQGRTFTQRETAQIARLPFTARGFSLPRLLLNFYARLLESGTIFSASSVAKLFSARSLIGGKTFASLSHRSPFAMCELHT